VRLQRLELVSYGAFESLAVDIGRGLTVVHGPNESGKSTTAHALADLLWGLRPRQHPYAFRVSPSRLLLRAETDDPAAPDDPAARLTLTVDSRGCHGPDGQDLAPWWRGGPVDTREAWTTALGLDLPRLREGGRNVLADGGDLARLLFQARTGIDVAGAIDRLTGTAEDLYKRHRSARKVGLRELAATVRSRMQETDRATSSADRVVLAREEAGRLTAARDAADRRFADRDTEHAAAEEDLRAWEPAVELATNRKEQERLRSQGRVLDEDDLRAAEEARREATGLTGRLATTDLRITTLDARLEALTVDPHALALAGTVEQLQGQQELNRRRAKETDENRTRLRTLREQLRAMAGTLDPRVLTVGTGSPEDLRAAVTGLILPSDVVDRLHRSARDLTDLAEEIRTENEEILAAHRRRAGLAPTGPGTADATGDCRSSRGARDRAWDGIRGPWLAGDLPDGPTRAELARRVEEAHRASDAAADRLAAHERLTGRIVEVDTQLATRTAHLEQLELRRAEAFRTWSELLDLAGIPPSADPAAWQVRAEALTVLAELLEDEQRLRDDLAGAERALADYTGAVAAVGDRLGLAGGDPWAVLPEAVARVRRATTDHALSENLRAEKDEALREREDLLAELAGHEAVTDRLRRAGRVGADGAGAGDEDLDAVMERSRTMAEERRREAELLRRIRQAARPGNDPEALAAGVAGTDRAELLARQERAAEARDEALADRDEARAALDRARRELRELEHVGDAAVLYARQVEATEELLAQMAEYVRTRVMIVLLGRLLAAQEPDHDTALLDHARELAHRLTAGRVTGLTVQDRAGVPGLRVEGDGLDAGGTQELSDGTADQVYLALRLAGIRQLQQRSLLAGHGTLPVLLDDVLVSHDDTRTALALEVLAGEARDQQIVLLAHHRAVADAAGPAGATVTHLPGP